jgi:hypothetical protein
VAGDVEANPIIEAIYRKLHMSKGNKLSADHFLCMLPSLIYSVTDQIIQDKVYADLEASHSGVVMERCPVSFPTFMYDSMIMQYGIMNIAIKVLMQLVNGLKTIDPQERWGYFVAQSMGLLQPPMTTD